MDVNGRIRAFIEDRGINITHLAKKIEMSKQNLSSILSNDDIKVSQLEKISNALGVPIEYFLDESKTSINIVSQGIGTNAGKATQHIVNAADCEKELEKALIEITYLKRENDLLRELTGRK